MNKITLKIDEKKHGVLTGNPEGIKVFQEQVYEKFDWDSINEIVIPENVNWISLSFVQGFCSLVFERFGKENIHNHIRFSTDNPFVMMQIKRTLPLI